MRHTGVIETVVAIQLILLRELMFIIEFDEDSNFKLGNQEMTMSEIKEKIIFETKSDENYAVVVKPSDKTSFQTTLYVLEDLNATKIKNVMLGINKPSNDKEAEQPKKSTDLPLLRKM